jgi:L-2-hydroxyglutarate oxidase LhgO
MNNNKTKRGNRIKLITIRSSFGLETSINNSGVILPGVKIELLNVK